MSILPICLSILSILHEKLKIPMKWAIFENNKSPRNKEGDALKACYLVDKAYKNTMVV